MAKEFWTNQNGYSLHHSDKDFRSFRKGTRKLNSKLTIPLNNNGVAEPRDTANMFKGLFQTEPPSCRPGMLSANEIKRNNPGAAVLPSFTGKNISTVINRMTRGKSPGYVGI